MWGEGITQDNFDAFVWRGATAAAERLWSTEESLGCPAATCPGIDPSKVRPGPSYWAGGSDWQASQVCMLVFTTCLAILFVSVGSSDPANICCCLAPTRATLPHEPERHPNGTNHARVLPG